jgi:hypothetical protein
MKPSNTLKLWIKAMSKDQPALISERVETPYWNAFRVVGTLAACVLIALMGYKFSKSQISIQISDFSFSEFLSLTLALFAIALSLIFYLKATETSNTFYDNTYKFTANVSEILGRIEAGFSERLRHLDEGYSRLGEKFDRMPLSVAKAEQQIAVEQEVVDEKQKQRDQLIDELFAKARLQDNEKSEYLKKLRQQEEELAQARNEVHTLQRRLVRAEAESEDLDSRVRRIMTSAIERLRATEIPLVDRKTVSRYVQRELARSPIAVARGVIERGLVDRDFDLTDAGYDYLKHLSLRTAA